MAYWCRPRTGSDSGLAAHANRFASQIDLDFVATQLVAAIQEASVAAADEGLGHPVEGGLVTPDLLVPLGHPHVLARLQAIRLARPSGLASGRRQIDRPMLAPCLLQFAPQPPHIRPRVALFAQRIETGASLLQITGSKLLSHFIE